MSEQPTPRAEAALTDQQLADGERYAGPHDPGPAEQYAGEPLPEPWEGVPDGELAPGAVPGDPTQ